MTTAMDDDVELTATDGEHEVRVIVAVGAGGRIRQILVSGVALLADLGIDDPRSSAWGSFPMAPWAGRIRNGRFDVLGTAVALDLNHQDAAGVGGGVLEPPAPATTGELAEPDRDRHSIHGTTFTRPWHVERSSDTHLEMSCALTGALGWPFAGIARQSITLEPHRLLLSMSVESEHGAVFPASLGWHPWFAKPDRLGFDPVAIYEKDPAGLPTGRLLVPPPGPWDDCFVNHTPVRLHYRRTIAPVVTVSSPADHWVVFDGLSHATAVEPQTGPPDAPTVRPELVAPGTPLGITMTIGWT